MDYDSGTAIAYFFEQIWRYFELVTPFFGLKVWHIVLGLFIIEISITNFADVFLGFFDTSAPSKQEQFKDNYRNSVWRERYKRFYK